MQYLRLSAFCDCCSCLGLAGSLNAAAGETAPAANVTPASRAAAAEIMDLRVMGVIPCELGCEAGPRTGGVHRRTVPRRGNAEPVRCLRGSDRSLSSS